jgi:2-succinyl-5-enolpyruvyl-6-hydroxy-3-cyclohexene-1-carboxylate synthase
MTPGFKQTAWSHLLVGTLAQSSIEHAVVCPGSRSTPVVAALLGQNSIKIHCAIDERSAGFLGLGLARGSASPVLLVCTSGTAAANLLPAIVESNLSGVPLVVLTADRPLELQFAHAPQTIDQTQLYGHQVRRFVELGEGPNNERALRSFRRLLLDAVRSAIAPHPGPVHLNFRARKPLEPLEPKDDDDRLLDTAVRSLVDETCCWVALAESLSNRVNLEPIAAMCSKNRRGLIMCGFDAQSPALDPEALAHFARVTGFPIWLDPSHPLRWQQPAALAAQVIHCADLLWQLDDFNIEFRPHLVVQIGSPMTSGHVETWLNQVGAENHVIFSRDGWPDPAGKATHLAIGDPSKLLSSVAARIDEMRGGLLGERAWFLDWRKVDTRAEGFLDRWFADRVDQEAGELSLVRAALAACGPCTQLVLGNSLPIREAATALPAVERDLRVFANRGANGIDGLVSTAVGVALARPLPTLVLVGDISFVHDLGALWSVRSMESPFVIVVIDNHGGRIFEQLPVRDSIAAAHLEAWTTPHSLELWAAGLLFGIETSRPTNVTALANTVSQALRRPEPTLIHVTCDPNSARLDLEALKQFLSERLFG